MGLHCRSVNLDFQLGIPCSPILYFNQLKPVIGYYQKSDLNQFNPVKTGSCREISHQTVIDTFGFDVKSGSSKVN